MKQSSLGIAVVGAGRIGTLRARLAAKHPSVRFLAISDLDPARARALAEQAGDPVFRFIYGGYWIARVRGQ